MLRMGPDFCDYNAMQEDFSEWGYMFLYFEY